MNDDFKKTGGIEDFMQQFTQSGKKSTRSKKTIAKRTRLTEKRLKQMSNSFLTENRLKPACSLGRDVNGNGNGNGNGNNTNSNGNNNFTCYDNAALIKLRTYWNMRHPDKKITTNSSKGIWNALNNNMRNTCDTETCWLNQKFVDNKVAKELRENSFAPEAPPSWGKNPSEWLSSTDIERVMKQYEKAYKCFVFLGPSPIDFDAHLAYGECVWEELCNIDIAKMMKKGKFKIGMIFNLDKHYQPGSHWVSMFVNLKKGYIFYFDSTGRRAGAEIKRLAAKIKEQAAAKGVKLEFIENNRQHQRQNNECGMYSLFAICTQLKDDRNPKDFLKGGEIKDHTMNELREKYFNPAGYLEQK